MALTEVISKLSAAEVAGKQEIYLNIIKLLNENVDSTYSGLNKEHVKNLCSSILNDLKKETVELPQLGKILQITFQNKNFQTFLPESEKVDLIKDVIYTIDPSEHENILVNCFSVLIQVPFNFKLENAVLNDLLKCLEDVLTKKNEPASTYSVCNFFQKFLRENEAILSEFTHILSKLVFLPLCHPSNKVREVAEKNLDSFPKILLYSCDEETMGSVLKLVKESYSKEMNQLFKEKQELYVLKVWKHVVNALGSALPKNCAGISSFFQVIEKGFKSPVDEICIASFNAWKSLIDTFAGSNGVLNDSKKLRFILKPFKNITRASENILLAACDAWMHLVWNLGEHLSSRFSEVCIPLLELTVGKIPNGLSEKTLPKGGSISLVKKSCYILLRFLEQPPSESFNRLSSPKKLPSIPYPTLQKPLDIKIITYHFKEILYTFKIIIDVCGTKEDMRASLDCLMKSVLFIVSAVIEDGNKESKEAITHYLNFLTDIIEAKVYPPLSCLKCIESLSKLPRKVLVSHCFNCGSRTTQVILCISLLKLLLNPHLFPSEVPKRFYATYNRLVQAGTYESFHPLLNTHKFMHVIRTSIGTNSFDVDMLIEIWSGVATPLLDTIEKTQEVNQGDKHEHDFSCMYDVLIFPFEFIYPVYIQQFRTRPAFKLWTSLYKAFIRSASLVATSSANEACENFCLKLKNLLKEENLQKPYFFESLCSHMQSIIEFIDFVSGTTSSAHGISDVALLMKRKKPLGNFASFVDLVAIILKAYLTHYIETEDSLQSTAPAIQRKLHIVKNGAPLDILKTFFSNIKSGSIIPYVLEQLVDPVSKLFAKCSQKRNSTNHIDSKLEMLWNVISSSIERYYLGPYDSEFLILMTPILEATFSHSRRNIKEKSRRFWFATFGPNASSLKFPDSLKAVLKKMKLSLLPDDISQTEFSISPISDSVSEDSIVVNVPSIPKPLVQNPEPFKSPLSVNGEASKVITKEKKQPPKISIDDLPSEEFVKIESPSISHRRNIRKRKSFVPSLYNDLSQDSATLMSSCESQDTTCSASLEKDDIKLPVQESKATSEKDPPNSSNKTISGESKGVLNSSLSSKFDDKIDKCFRKNSEIILIESPDGNSEIEKPNSKKLKSDSPSQEKVEEKDKDKHSKISVFSMSGDKKIALRSTRKRLSQSFSVLFSKKESEKLGYQKLSKSCSELIDLSDSEEIIPSSQGSSETENSIKLSLNSEQEKSQVVGSFISDLKEVEPTSSCVTNQNEELSKENSESEGKNLKIITSTPSKSKIPSLIDDSEACETAENHEDVLDINSALPIRALNSDKPVLSSTSVQIADAEEHISINEPKMHSSSKETITDSNFLLDAVDNMVDVDPQTVETDKKIAVNLEPQQDIEMKDVSASNEKLICSISINIEDGDVQSRIVVPVEPTAKKSRLDLKKPETVSSEPENYTKKLRKKNVSSVPKSQPKGRKKKEVKKIASLIKENESNGNMNGNKVFDSETNKTEIKSNEQVCQQPENLDFVENIHPSCDICIEQSIEKSNISEAKDSLNNVENIGNAESCEIFDAFSDSCKASVDNFKEQNDSEMMSVDSKDSDSISDSGKINSDADSQSSEANEIQSEVLDANDHNVINIVPCSLEDDKIMETSCKSVDEAVSDKTVTDFDKPIEQSFVELSAQSVNVNKNDKEMPDSLPIQFSIIEDSVSCEMHDIVESIVSACSENSIDDTLKNQAISTEQSKQLPMTSDKEKASSGVGNNSDLSLATLNKSPEVDNETSNDNSEKLPKYDSTELVLSSESEIESSPEIVENSVAMDIENIPSIIRNGDLDKSKENQIELKPADISENSLTMHDGKNVPLELDHPYSISNQQSEICVVSDNVKDNAVVNDDILNLRQTNEKITVSIKHNQTERGIFDKTADMGICASTNKEMNLKSSETESTITSQNSLKLNSASDREYKNEMSTERDFLEGEIGCIIKELIVKVERLDYCQIVSQNLNLTSSTDKSYINSDNLNSNTAADKENQVSLSANDDVFAKGSKKRKIKPPIRSPFNFRQRTKMKNSEKIQKGMKSYVSQIKSISEKSDLIIRPIFPNEEKVDNSMASYISKLVDTIAVDDEDDVGKEIHPDEASASEIAKERRLELSTDELTDLNTRLNASTAPQTRRSKLIASVHKTPEPESEPIKPNVVILCSSANSSSSSKLTSILKKRKSSETYPPSKARRVTFASPLIHEVLIENISEAEGIEVVTMNRIHSLSRRRNKILQEKNKKTIPSVPVLPVSSAETDDVPSSSEYQDSDVLDFNELPVSPALINCPDKVTNILKDLTSPSWIRGLESLLVSKSIKTIGDLCKLNIHQVKALPFKSPKVFTLHKALMGYINTTQEATLQKFKTIDDGSFEAEVPSSSNLGNFKTAKNTENLEENASKSLEEAVVEVVKKGRLKELPLSVLGQLVEACGKAIIEKNKP